MIKIYTWPEFFNPNNEFVVLFGLCEKLHNWDLNNNYNGESKLAGTIEFCKANFIYTNDVEYSDIIVLPSGFNISSQTFVKLNELSIKYNKPLVCFYCADDDKTYPIGSNVILFRTSFYKSTKLTNEYAFPVFGPDYFNNSWIDENCISMGYCGNAKNNRLKYLRGLEQQKEFKTNFIVRDKVWSRINNKQAQIDYFNNMCENMFIFCYRGAGNFSWRFYEIFMMGRIPIIIDTDCVYPYDGEYDLNDHAVVIKESDVKKIYHVNIKLRKFITCNKGNLINIQKSNRILWEKYFSPCGFLLKFKEQFEKF